MDKGWNYFDVRTEAADPETRSLVLSEGSKGVVHRCRTDVV